MKDTLILWALTSAALILAVAALRAALGRRVSGGVRYALWAVVLARLLVPVQLFTVPVPAAVPQIKPSRPVATIEPVGFIPAVPEQTAPQPAMVSPPPEDVVVNITQLPEPEPPRVVTLNVAQTLGRLWLAGSVVTAAVFLLANFSFGRRLRRVRVPMGDGCSFSREKKNQKELQFCGKMVENCSIPVYIAPNLPSPCLFGVLRPAIYVTPEAAEDPDTLRHVLAHETVHLRHGDHLWNVLRGAALALHWWNPLVWLAAALSRRDCELACDDGALKLLGEGERFAYGRTLLSLIGEKPRPVDLLSCATTMTAGQKNALDRVTRIARAPKCRVWAAVTAVLLAAVVSACAFGQAEEVSDQRPDCAELLRGLSCSVPEGDGSAEVQITGLEDLEVTWSADTSPSKGLLYFNGDLGLFGPRLEGKTVSPGSAVWADGDRAILSVVMNVSGGPDAGETAGLYAHFVVEHESGTVTMRDFPPGPEGEVFELTEEEMADMGCILAGLLNMAEEYHFSAAPQLPWPEGGDSLRYVRDKGGFPDEFAIRLHQDGTFTYYEGMLSSFIGAGTWTQEGDVICLADERNEDSPMYHYFTLEKDALVFRAEKSSKFLYVDVADGERFSLDAGAPAQDWFDHTGNEPSPSPSADPSGSPDTPPADPSGSPDTPPDQSGPVYTLDRDGSTVTIGGLGCEASLCMRGGWVVHSPFDWTKAITVSNEQLGMFTARDPRFLGGIFSADTLGRASRTLTAFYYPYGNAPRLYLLFEDPENGVGNTGFAVEAEVDLSAGTVTEKNARDGRGQAMEVDDAELVNAARTLAELIRGAADYYKATVPTVPFVTDLTDFAAPSPGSYQTFVLSYQGRETRFTGTWYHMPEQPTLPGQVIDLDGDGRDEIVVILPEGGGTGAWSNGLYVFDAETLEQFSADSGPFDSSGLVQRILEEISSTGDEDNFYLTGPGLDVTISKEDVRRDYNSRDIPMDNALILANIIQFSVENGAVHCDLPCSFYRTDAYIGALDVTLGFSRAEGFRCVSAKYDPYEP